MSGITPHGHLFTLVRNQALSGVESVLFLSSLVQRLDQKLLVIWDGSPIHRGHDVKDFLSNGGARQVHLEQLPSYAPDLNPDEGTWQYLKQVELRNVCCLSLSHLHHELGLAIRRLRRKKAVIQTFFAGAGLAL